MKKKRVTIQYVMEVPAKDDPFKYFSIGGGQLVNVVEKKITKEEDIGDVDNPWDQKMREFYAVKSLIHKGIKTGLEGFPLTLQVFGSTWEGKFNYDPAVYNKGASKIGVQPGKVDIKIHGAINSLDIECEKGVLTWSYHGRRVTTMSVGNPNIVEEIANFIRQRIK